MAVFHAFRALRPTPEKAADVAALPYDVVNREEAKSIGDENPLSFLHIDRPEMDLEPETDLYDDRVYEKAKENLDNMEEKGILVQDQKACYYIYELVRKGKTQTGIVGCSSIDDYMNGVVKKHELTREDKEQDRIHHVDSCNANTGPIFLACRYPDSLLTLMNNWKDHHEAAYDFTEEDQITHRVWVIVFPYDQLCILPYNRIVKDLNGLTVKAFLGAMKFNFELMLMPGFPCKPVEKHCMGMYVDGQWYHLKAWPDIYDKKDVVGQLDVSILQEKVLRPVLGIEDPRTDQRISFVGGSHKAAELAEIADRTGGVAFVMYPTSMEDLMKIADENKLMPPKSTWFEPKLRSGLFIHKL